MRETFPEVLEAIEDAVPGPSGWYRVPCPFCAAAERGNARKRKLSVHAVTGFFQCWRPACGMSGFITLEDRHLQRYTPDPTAVDDDGTRPLPEEYVALPAAESELGLVSRPFWRYLTQERHVSQQAIVEAQLGFAVRGRYAQKVVIPITAKSQVVGFTTRSIIGKQFDTPPGFARQRFFLNEDALFEKSDEPIALVEGPFDCLRQWPLASSCLGKPSHMHATRLLKVQRPVVVCLDSDAQDLGWDLALALEFQGVDARWLKIPPTLDPGKLPHDVFTKMLLQARPASATNPAAKHLAILKM